MLAPASGNGHERSVRSDGQRDLHIEHRAQERSDASDPAAFREVAQTVQPNDEPHAVAHVGHACERYFGCDSLGGAARGLHDLPRAAPRQIQGVEDVHAADELLGGGVSGLDGSREFRRDVDRDDLVDCFQSAGVGIGKGTGGRLRRGRKPLCGVHAVKELLLAEHSVFEGLVADGHGEGHNR